MLNLNGKSRKGRWDDYIEAMRGPLSSLPPDIYKIDATMARKRAEERFFLKRDQHSANRNNFYLSAMLKRQTG